MATNDDTPCVGSASEDIVEEKEEFKNKSWRTDGTLKVTGKVEEEAEEDIVEEEEEFKNKSWRTDVTLKVGDRLFYANKLVLGLASPVFEAMFSGEEAHEDLTEIPLLDKKSNDVLEFLRCIYPNVMKSVTMENVFSVLPLADEYQVTRLKKTCESFLLKSLDEDISSEELCSILNIAHTYKMCSVLDKGEQIAITRPRVDFVKACIEVSMPRELKSKLLNKMWINIEADNQNLLKENSTASVLCSCLGHIAKQSPLVDEFLQGKITGRAFSFALEYPYNKSFDIDIYPFTFNVCFAQSKFRNWGNNYKVIFTTIKCCNLDKDTLDCVSFVIPKSRISNDEVNIQENKFCFKMSNPSNKGQHLCTTTIEDETKGWSYKGICNFDVYLFIYH